MAIIASVIIGLAALIGYSACALSDRISEAERRAGHGN